MICSFVLDERDLLRVGLFAIGLPLFAVAITALRRVQIRAVHRVVPERLRPGSRGQAVLIISNSGLTRSPSIEISEPPVAGLTTGMRHLIAPIRGGESARVIYPVNAETRGRSCSARHTCGSAIRSTCGRTTARWTPQRGAGGAERGAVDRNAEQFGRQVSRLRSRGCWDRRR